MPGELSLSRAQWEVMWVTTKGGKRIVAVDFEFDYVSALELYVKASRAKKSMVTLRSKNVGFEPPEKYADKMMAYNRQGVWWCPYCMKLRRFEKRVWTEIADQLFATDPQYCCPMCEITHHNWWVRKYNPIAARIYEGKRRTRGRKSRSGRRKRR